MRARSRVLLFYEREKSEAEGEEVEDEVEDEESRDAKLKEEAEKGRW